MEETPSISAFCTTFGRPKRLIEEMIECFLRQDYAGESELVVLQDWDQQTLQYNGDDRVKIINLTARITPLGKVFNETISYCEGDIIMPWESDDIFLPHRMTYTIDHMKDGYFHTPNAWFYDEGNDDLKPMGNYCLCNVAAHKDHWKAVGYFDDDRDVAAIDVALMGRFKDVTGVESLEVAQEDAFYIYRWNNGSCHASGWGGDMKGMAARVAGTVINAARRGEVETGVLDLEPHWRIDYSELVAGYTA